MSKVTLDEKVCLKHKLTLQEVLIALAVRAGSTNETVKNLLEREVIVERNGDFLITQHWNDVLDEVLCDSENKGIDLSDERLLALAKKVQECFPIMKMRYASGQDSPFYFRCNKTEIKNKLKKFLTIYGDVADEDIIDATKRYVATYASKGYLGMRLAKYFILKDDRKLGADEEVHVEQLSDLATFLENKGSEEEEATNDDDWLISSRN
jgi:sulfur carrier protein ThiS